MHLLSYYVCCIYCYNEAGYNTAAILWVLQVVNEWFELREERCIITMLFLTNLFKHRKSLGSR
jgi:hypothetical protein